MFEKEAEEYTVENVCSSCYFEKPCENKCEAFGCADSKTYVLKAFKEGAEFGYNKANEWHYVKDGDFPKELKNVWCYCKGMGTKFCCVGHTIVNGDNEVMWWANNKSEELRVIAWKEIVLPELQKESE